MPEYSEKMTLEKSSEDDCTLTSSGIENEMTGGTPVKAMKTLSNTLRQPLETAKEFADNLNLRQKNQSVSTPNGSKDEGDETRTTQDTVRRVEVDNNRVRRNDPTPHLEDGSAITPFYTPHAEVVGGSSRQTHDSDAFHTV